MEKKFLAMLLGLLVLTFSTQSQAVVNWNWAFGTEAGTLTTDGTLADMAGPFTFTITAFTVASSSVPGNIGQTFAGSQLPQGFIWDGTQPTQFFRSGGTFTNGSNFFGPAPGFTYSYGLQPPPGISFLRLGEGASIASGVLALSLAVLPLPSATAVPISRNGIFILALLLLTVGILFIRRKRVLGQGIAPSAIGYRSSPE